MCEFIMLFTDLVIKSSQLPKLKNVDTLYVPAIKFKD